MSPPQSPAIPMSQLIAHDAPLLSPVQASYPMDDASYNYNYYLPPSPPNSIGSANNESPMPAGPMLKCDMSSNTSADFGCVSTHQLFDLSQQQHHQDLYYMPPSPPRSTSPRLQHHHQRLSLSIKPPTAPSLPVKRSASPIDPAAPKKRAVAERISTKDFVPPDVSGLSKREARLVKNRAAAFLSRQRKREEFEYMEIRVTELEKENARLLALTNSGGASGSQSASNDLVSEIDQLRAQLAAAQERERELAAELSSKAVEPEVKRESSEESALSSSPAKTPQVQHKSSAAASLGLMQVLLCALPSLLSMPTQNAIPSFSPSAIPTSPTSGSASFDFDLNSLVPGGWNGNDMENPLQTSSTSLPKKLEFAAGEFGNLDISFDTSPSEDGKIRVRIHPASSVSSRATSPGVNAVYPNSKPHETSSAPSSSASPASLAMWSEQVSYATPPSSSSFSQYDPTLNPGDPFFGVGASTHYDYDLTGMSSDSQMYGSSDMSSLDFTGSEYGYGSEYSADGNSKRRVRIALKSMPVQGGEGGEWEVQWR